MDNELIQEILEIIRNKDLTEEELKEKLSQYHESDIADAVPLLSEEERDEFYKHLSDEEMGELLNHLEAPEEALEDMNPEKAADVLETMDADDAIDILEEMDEDDAKDILDEMEKESREDIELIQNFEEDEIGSKITTNFITLKKEFTIKEAMRQVVKEAPENDNIYNLFVLDENQKFYGTVILKDLIIAREGSPLNDIIKTNYPYLYATEKVEDVINEIKDMDLDIIPVLDKNDNILGVITSRDIIETVDEEMTEDYVKFAAVDEDADVDDTLFQSVKRRVPWLGMLLILDIFTSTVLSGFDEIYTILPGLVLFQSWILDSAGNAGTQSLALTIRSITADEIDKKTFWKHFFKELLTGLFDGLLVGICGFLVSFVFLIVTKQQIHSDAAAYASSYADWAKASSVVGISLLVAIPFTSLAGLFIPVFFKKIHIDPAVASGPLITTLSDMFGVAIYYSIAALLFAAIL